MKKVFLFILILLIASALQAKKVSLVLGTDGSNFDPWNQTKWSQWYSGGVLVEPFEIDMSVTFASRGTPWTIDISNVRPVVGANPALFVLNTDGQFVIDGCNVVIDARYPTVRTWSLQYYYTHSVNTTTDYFNGDGILLWQTANSNGLASTIKNLTLQGFWRGISASHFHLSSVIIDNVTLERNVWGLFPRGANVTVKNSRIWENVLGGFYGEYNSYNWLFENNIFRDNDTKGTISYGDVVLDACYNYTIRSNYFEPASYTPRTYHTAVSLYRNAGENSDIREHASHDHLIENNTFNSYNVAIDFAVRTGESSSIDQSSEARCYVDRNIVRDNTFNNCIIGIILRSNFNTIDNNRFNNVQRSIVLNNVFYSMYNNTIINEPNETAWLWSEESDFSAYAAYLPYSNGLGSEILPSEKFYHIISYIGTPHFVNPSNAQVFVSPTLIKPDSADLNSDLFVDLSDLSLMMGDWLLQPGKIGITQQSSNIDGLGSVNLNDFDLLASQWLNDNPRLDYYGVNNKPIDIAVGNFAVQEDGDEIAVIFNRQSSQIGLTKYYTIITYNQDGIELDRCGRSTMRWKKIVCGNFLEDTGYIKQDDNYEIAAISSSPDVNGCYPIYVFRKGFAKPAVCLAGNNTIPIANICAGNFKADGDNYDEIAIIPESSTLITLYKPSDANWTRTISNAPSDVVAMACGDFDGLASNGTEIVCARAAASPLLLYRTGTSGSYSSCGNSAIWTLVTAGNFDGGLRPRDEIAAVSHDSDTGKSKIDYFIAGQSIPFKTFKGAPLDIAPTAISAGNFNTFPNDAYEKYLNISAQQLESAVSTWGEHLAVLPSNPVELSIPVFWINVNPADSNQAHYRLIPIIK